MASNEKIQKIVDGVDQIDDTSVDYDYSRDKYKELLDTGVEILPTLKELVKDSEHPRAFEVFYGALRQLADINDKLLNMHRKKQVIDASKPESAKELGGTYQPEADGEVAYHGTTAGLLAAIETIKAQKVEDAEFTEIKGKGKKKEPD